MYAFPHLTNISDILPAIEGSDEFIIKRDVNSGIQIVNYLFTTETTFPDPLKCATEQEARFAALRRECRGIEFDLESGDIVTRKYHKFFNANQLPETQIGNVDWSRPHVILEKLDGSLLTPYKRKDGVREWHTKMGLTEVALPVSRFVQEQMNLPNYASYDHFCDDMHEFGMTPLFEWCSRQQRIVVDYKTESLVLTGIRKNATGQYVSYNEMKDLASHLRIPIVRALPGSVENIHEFMAEVQDLEDCEGYIVRFLDTGEMIKIKGKWYCQIHNTKDSLARERNVWEMILEERVDDVIPFMDEDDRRVTEQFIVDFEEGVKRYAHMLSERVSQAREVVGADKKRFALEYASQSSSRDKGLLFSIFDGKNPLEVTLQYMRKNIGSQPKLETIRDMVGGISWYRYYKLVAIED